jgi:arylsulfatase A
MPCFNEWSSGARPRPGLTRITAWLAALGMTMFLATLALSAAPPSGEKSDADREGISQSERKTPGTSKSLKSPLLRGLQQSIGELEAFEESGTAGALTQQLEQADSLLTSVREQNRRTLRSVNRQQRVGRARQSPNLLLITIDRLGWQELGCYGQEQIQTPRIDALAEQGLRLSRFYAGSADATAARWTLLNGLNTGHAPTDREDRFRLHGADRSMPQWLWDAGYVTSFFGLWPNGDLPTQHGYEDWSGFLNSSEIAGGYPESIRIDGAEIAILANQNGARQISMNRLLTSELHSWFNDVRSQRRQFFAHIALPVIVDQKVTGPEAAAQAHREAVENVDRLVGQLLDVLGAAGLTDRTCVVLTAESGPAPSHGDLVRSLDLTGELAHAKHGLAEGNLRVPLILRWPRYVAPGSVSDYPASVCDLLPTLCDLAVASKRPGQTDGVSLLPLLVGRDQPEHPLLYWETTSDQKGQIAQAGAWKCVRLPGSRDVSLFNLEDDPGEVVNVAERHPEVLQKLTR